MTPEEELAHLRSEVKRLKDSQVFGLNFERGEPEVTPSGISLVETGCIDGGGEGPAHTLIEGENLHALALLTETHTGKVDCIYIDPPYNTGVTGRRYKDAYGNGARWLAFMENRLLLAKKLLKDTGVIIVAVGDDEHHRLRMLMDQIFGANNFISNVVWYGGRKNDSRYVSNSADYMLVYAASETSLSTNGIRWQEKKLGIDTALAAAKDIWAKHGGDHATAEKHWQDWLKKAKDGGATSSITNYGFLSASGVPEHHGDSSFPGGGGPRYEVLHPVTGKPVKIPSRGWCWTQATMQELIDDDLIYFGPDENRVPSRKLFLDEQNIQVAESVFYEPRRRGTNHLTKILGDKRFPHPKDHGVLARWIGLVTPKDGVVLDFFAGSGSTVDAVMRLNQDDGGTRQCIAVTNNEVSAKEAKVLRKAGLRPGDDEWEELGIAQHVTIPRIEAIVSGKQPSGEPIKGKDLWDDERDMADGIATNVKFFKLTYENPDAIRLNRRYEKVALLLWLKAGGRGDTIRKRTDTFATTDSYAVLFEIDAASAFLEAVDNIGASDGYVAYVVTDDDTQYQSVCAQMPSGVEVVRLYESYLRNFEINTRATLPH